MCVYSIYVCVLKPIEQFTCEAFLLSLTHFLIVMIWLQLSLWLITPINRLIFIGCDIFDGNCLHTNRSSNILLCWMTWDAFHPFSRDNCLNTFHPSATIALMCRNQFTFYLYYMENNHSGANWILDIRLSENTSISFSSAYISSF